MGLMYKPLNWWVCEEYQFKGMQVSFTLMVVPTSSGSCMSRPSLQVYKQSITLFFSSFPDLIIRPAKLPRKYCNIWALPPTGREGQCQQGTLACAFLVTAPASPACSLSAVMLMQVSTLVLTMSGRGRCQIRWMNWNSHWPHVQYAFRWLYTMKSQKHKAKKRRALWCWIAMTSLRIMDLLLETVKLS